MELRLLILTMPQDSRTSNLTILNPT
ncbi:hypothetical protein [Psittacicella melopsittaci]